MFGYDGQELPYFSLTVSRTLKVMAYNICKICLQHIFIQITMATKKIALKEVATIVR